MKRLLDAGENEQVLIVFLQEIAQSTPEEIDAQRSAPDWQDLVDAAHVWPRSVEAVGEYEFKAARFANVTTPMLLLSGERESPILEGCYGSGQRCTSKQPACYLRRART